MQLIHSCSHMLRGVSMAKCFMRMPCNLGVQVSKPAHIHTLIAWRDANTCRLYRHWLHYRALPFLLFYVNAFVSNQALISQRLKDSCNRCNSFINEWLSISKRKRSIQVTFYFGLLETTGLWLWSMAMFSLLSFKLRGMCMCVNFWQSFDDSTAPPCWWNRWWFGEADNNTACSWKATKKYKNISVVFSVTHKLAWMLLKLLVWFG